MLITLTSGGSRGDAQPYIALAHGFKRAGHHVRFVTTPDYAPLVEGAGFDCRYVDLTIRSLMESEQGKAMLDAGGNPLKFLQGLKKLLAPVVERMLIYAQENFPGSDALIVPSSGAMFGSVAFEWLCIPFCTALLQPLAPTGIFQNPFFPPFAPWIPAGKRFYNRCSYAAADIAVKTIAGPVIRRALKKMGINPDPPAPQKSLPRPLLLGFSPLVVAPPRDWQPHVKATGYWFLDLATGFSPPAGLVDFINAGPRPVSIGFGSMNNRNPEEFTRLIVEALRISGRRGVLIAGWGGMQNTKLPDSVFLVDSVPHDWLFPRMAAVIHHCGAGTTGAGLAAGVPAVAVPFFADQIFWARRLHELGVAPKPIPRKRLTAENLAQAITTAIHDREMKVRAEELGEKIRSEDGVGVAVEIAERYFSEKKINLED
jgi:sterol 3beta-glucosyltransferase